MTIANDHRPVALFTGATAGLGEAILKAYARNHENSRIYFIGRNDAAAQQIIEDVRKMWKENSQRGEGEGEGDIVFVKADLTLFKNARDAVQEILRREGDNVRLDFLCMSQGFLTFKGRLETAEHHDAPQVLQFYSRAYLTYLLLPYLRSSNASHGPRVISVHIPGHEGSLWLEDLELKQRHPSILDWIFPSWFRSLTGLDPGYVRARISHSAIMTTLFFEQLAQQERQQLTEARSVEATECSTVESKRNVSFLHVYPGLVKTKEFEKGDFPYVVKILLTKIMLPLITPLTVKAEKVGESIALMAEDSRFRCARSTELGEAEVMEVGSDGVIGSGSYCLRWDGKRLIKDKTMKTLREKRAGEAVWAHCMDVFNAT